MERTHGLVGDAGSPLLLVNVWDVTSVRVAIAAGAAAVGTSSFAVALDHGAQVLDPSALAAVAAALVAAAAGRAPVSIDLEFGGDDVAATVTAVVTAGAAGVNIEDVSPTAPGALVPIDEQVGRLARARAAAGDALFINARCDEGFGSGASSIAEAVRRCEAYAAAGADGFFVPGLLDLEVLRELCARVSLPVNVMIGVGVPALADLASAGVRRISQGGEPFLAAVGAQRQQLDAYLGGELGTDMTAMMTGASMLPTFVS
jgi:2-methylisocitrate lyase-like PEP mutase family enzyme